MAVTIYDSWHKPKMMNKQLDVALFFIVGYFSFDFDYNIIFKVSSSKVVSNI